MPEPTQPEHAWKVLSTTNEWIRHADAKTGVALAFVGVTGTLLFNVARTNQGEWSLVLNIVVLAGIAALVVAVGFAAGALFPRTRTRKERKKLWRSRATSSNLKVEASSDQVNLLFFGHVATHYKDDGPTYQQVLSLLTKDQDRLTEQIAAQVHENSHVAVIKFKRVNRAIILELIAVGCLIATVVLSMLGM
ncbi:hypothetical protein GCM10027403_36760 [Arthrobacter tecti]